MEIAYHIGANCTDGDRLLKSVLRNADALAAQGVAVPGPGRYRQVLREAIMARARGEGAEGSREVLLDAILDAREARRVVLSNSTFLALPAKIFDGGQIFGNAASKVAALRAIFPEDRVELHIALRNPATWIPAVWGQAKGRPLDAFLGGADPRAIAWSDLIGRLRASAPDMPLTVWCNEDTPLIWGELLGRLGGVDGAAMAEGRWDLLSSIMSAEGLERFEKYMAQHPGQTSVQERRVIGAFLDKYALPEETWEEVDLPGWDEAMVEDLTRAYEADMGRIAAMDGVAFVQP